MFVLQPNTGQFNSHNEEGKTQSLASSGHEYSESHHTFCPLYYFKEQKQLNHRDNKNKA
jgi:hypothetical protein